MSTAGLVLSCFPGLGLLDRGFEGEGFCVVRSPDVIWGGDIGTFHPPVGVFDGVIGGDPCQSHSALVNLVRAKGLEPTFPDMTPEFQRVIEEARPRWFLRENVPKAPDIKPAGYDVRTFLLDNWASLGEEQQRRRRFWFGVRDGKCPELRRWIEFAFRIPSASALSMDGGHDDGRRGHREGRKAPVTGRHDGHVGAPGVDYSTRYTLAEMLDLQGLPPTFLDHCPFTVAGKRKAIGNGVPQAMARAIARAVAKAI